MTVATTSSSSTIQGSQVSNNTHRSVGMLAATLAFPGMLFLIPGVVGRSRRKRLMMYLGMFMIVGSLIGFSACGGSKSFTPTNPSNPGTPSGTYTVTITGTFGSVTHTQTVTLTVN